MKKILFFIGITFFLIIFFSVLWDYNMIEEFYSICTGFTGFLPSDDRVYQDVMERLKEDDEFFEKVLLSVKLFLFAFVMIAIFYLHFND